MDKHTICKICNRRFANGKAMGGHMRSHLAKHPIPPKTNNNPSSSSSLSNMQTNRSVHRQFFDLEDESEAESSRNLTAKTRSKRPCKTTATTTVVAPAPPRPQPEPESVSSVTENIFSVKEVALCLLMLSRDKRPLQKDKLLVVDGEVDEYIRDENEEEDDDTDEEEYVSCLVRSTNDYRFRCKTCKKGFPSYQALGGHKASHKKIKISGAAGDDVVVMDQRIFECPFCDKVFDSGQALGGHKKIHFTYLAVPIPKNSAKKSGAILIDLNLPAPEEDGEVSQI